ncbi:MULTISPECIES: YafY family protein [unclassified Achromobacter]|uniref:helix-turn-helix transcriptional regulator n=1 Tax=unclassified Achromobacter TaxID=2626865 RepID=UPI000B51BEDA|nr:MULTISPECIES: YafY family protein [unclassified Achromobacter]OWT80034.1 transcriptional regulator [Achromobacter sp. HZ34]OWT81917.1 transcriptional regulator [Achromobacter sp. HZ28]
MSRAERLLELMQCLRRHRQPVSGQALAAELGVSLRTLYRDIASLQAQGAHIQGEPGLGYVLQPGFLLPPLMFSASELEALMLGARWVMKRTDVELARDAQNALAKISAVLPADLRQSLHDSTLLVAPAQVLPGGEDYLPLLRLAIRKERKVSIRYRDEKGRDSERVIWPFLLGYFERMRMVGAWCERRDALRHFRVDRILALTPVDERYPTRRLALLKQWRETQGIPATP